MRVLWITNGPIAIHREQLGISSFQSGGWLDAAYEKIKDYPNLEIGLASIHNCKDLLCHDLNEAMSSGCAVVASDAIGSAPFLIENGKNGYMYRDGDINDLLQKVCSLIDNPQKRNQFSDEAIKTIGEEWSIENATNNLIKLIQGLHKDGKTPIETGPCSLA